MDGEVRAEFDRLHDEEKRQNHRLDELENGQADIRELVISVKELAVSAKYTNEKLDKVEKDVESIKTAPLKSINEVKGQAWKTAITVIITALVAGMLWLLSNHGGI